MVLRALKSSIWFMIPAKRLILDLRFLLSTIEGSVSLTALESKYGSKAEIMLGGTGAFLHSLSTSNSK